jgi:dolichol-phosphate mannosyltransferase
MKETRMWGMARRNKTEIRRFGKFAAVGFSGMVVDFALLNILTYFFHMDKALAIAVAFVFAAMNNFVWNRLWVYPESRGEQKRRLLPVFLGVNAIGLAINELIYFLFNVPISNLLGGFPVAWVALHHQGLGLNLTKAIAAGVVMMWNYVVNRRVTFRNVKWEPKPDLESAI